MEWLLVDNLDNDIGICCGQLFYYVLCQRFEILIVYKWTKSE